MKVLMATDGSVHSGSAMLTAGRLLRTREVEVDILSVSPEILVRPSSIDSQARMKHANQLSKRTQRIVDEAQRLLARTYLKTHGVVAKGSPADKLLQMAEDYDLTVVGAYGNHDRKQPGLGPVTSRLLQLGKGNLLIGRELVNQNNYRVLLALDSSGASLTALQSMISLFDSSSLEVNLIHVLEMPWAAPISTQSQDEEIDVSELEEYERQLEHELRQTASTITESALRQLEAHSIPAAVLIKEGDPALEICSEADEGGYDLVVAGATGVSDVKHAVLGSVSLKVAWDSPCSVAIMRQPVR